MRYSILCIILAGCASLKTPADLYPDRTTFRARAQHETDANVRFNCSMLKSQGVSQDVVDQCER